MDNLAASPPELRARGFKALVEVLGWASAVRFLRQFEPGAGDYTEERDTILPGRGAHTLTRRAGELRSRDRR